MIQSGAAVLSLDAKDEEAMRRLGADLALALKAGDLLALRGDLGAGKTTLARALIRSLADDPRLEVPSPTFTLVQDYPARVPVLHVDLYRLSSAQEVDELGLDEALGRGILLVEWPERAEGTLPGEPINVSITHEGEGRHLSIEGPAHAVERIGRSLAKRQFLAQAGQEKAERHFLLGDASTRAYETITETGLPSRILMDAPKRPDGPAIRDGKPYSQIAHLAETVTPFVAVGNFLRARGLAAPVIHAQDLDGGLLLIEHLGDGTFLQDGAPVPERYRLAAEVLAHFHSEAVNPELAVDETSTYRLPPYDLGALGIEVELLLDWYLPMVTGSEASPAVREQYNAAWSMVFDALKSAEKHLVIRDYHSPNLIWRPDCEGLARVGVIDFQDAVIGPSTYDVASLAMDARVTVDPDLERQIVNAYVAARQAQGPFDQPQFESAYAIMAAQRNAKILGIFVRLDRRDGKPHYLRHLPRIRSYFTRAISHPVLQPVRAFVEEHGILKEADGA